MATPGFRFKDGKLYLFGGEGEVTIIESWPKLRSVRKEPAGQAWKPWEPGFRLVRPYRRAVAKVKPPPPQLELSLQAEGAPLPQLTLAEMRKRAFDGFRFSLPKEVAKRTELFGSHQWRLLRMFRERMESLELAAQNPALAFCLANAHLFRALLATDSALVTAEISKSRQCEIAGWLGFPQTEAAARILSRILPEAVHPIGLRRLADALRDENTVRALSHLTLVNTGVIALAGEPTLFAAVSPKLLNEVAGAPAERYRAQTAGLLTDILAMARQLARTNLPTTFASMARVREVHGELSTEFCQLAPGQFGNRAFSRPPLPGTPDIFPLRSSAELVIEGSEQSNCVASYIPRVVAKEVYIYRILRPERATLSIVPAPGGGWEIDQLLLSRNRPVSAATTRMVEAWIEGFLGCG